ncbi:MAG: hypothetical protein WBR17_23725, partial [Paraburkholderia sp.]|uniref:hypothetical protein n=1 Tax=Paraburkholderia sp. TaxID=1926495 RepID=UPI003C56FE15
RTFGGSDKALISSHSALRASRMGLHGKPGASFNAVGAIGFASVRRSRAQWRTPASNEMWMRRIRCAATATVALAAEMH